MIGVAKKHSAYVLRQMGLGVPGGIWAVRCKVKPIAGRQHQLAAVEYVRKHKKKGGAVWSQIGGGA